MKISAPEKPARIENLPKRYSELCSNYLPRPIHNESEYKVALNAIQMLMGFESRLTPDQTDYVEAVTTFIEHYEEKNTHWPSTSAKEALSFLLKEHGMSSGDLAKLLNVDLSMGNKLLRGDRNLTVNHIRKLSQNFAVSPEMFI